MTVKAMNSGAVEFLRKPFRDQDLIDAIQHALKRNRETRREQDEVAQLKERYGTLTAREREVIHLALQSSASGYHLLQDHSQLPRLVEF